MCTNSEEYNGRPFTVPVVHMSDQQSQWSVSWVETDLHKKNQEVGLQAYTRICSDLLHNMHDLSGSDVSTITC